MVSVCGMKMSATSLVTVLVLCLLLEFVVGTPHKSTGSGEFHQGVVITPMYYSHEYLLSLQYRNDIPPSDTDYDLLEMMRNGKRKSRKKRGSRGGVRNRLKRNCYRPPLPVITLSNVHSLHNKLDELSTLIHFDADFRRTSLPYFTKTWLSEQSRDIDTDFEGFEVIRFDRDKTKTEKSISGGLCMLVNKKWATNYCVRERVSTRSYAILTVSFHPHYLPREFGQVTVILTYISGPDNAHAAQRVAEGYNAALSRSVDQAVFIGGDFNTCDIMGHLPNLHQYVSCATRLNKTLDHCYDTIPDAYTAVCRPPLG